LLSTTTGKKLRRWLTDGRLVVFAVNDHLIADRIVYLLKIEYYSATVADIRPFALREIFYPLVALLGAVEDYDIVISETSSFDSDQIIPRIIEWMKTCHFDIDSSKTLGLWYVAICKGENESGLPSTFHPRYPDWVDTLHER
jgi:hypothetical protein